MMRERRYGGNSRLRSPSPSRRRLSPPLKARDFRNSPSRRRDGLDMEEERRGGKYPRGDHDRRYDRGDRDRERNFNRGGRDYDRSFNRGGARISGYDVGDRERKRGRGRDADSGRSGSMYQPSGDGEYSRRLPKYSEGMSLVDSTSSKFKWGHLLDEPRKSDLFWGSIDRGTGSGVRNELEHPYERRKFFDKGRGELVLDSKPISLSMEADREGLYSSSSYQMNLPVVPKSCSHVDSVGGCMSLQSGYLNSSLHKGEDFHFRDKLHLDKLGADRPLARDPLARVAYGEDYPLPYPRVDLHYTGSFSHSKAFDKVPPRSLKEDIPGSLREDLCLPSDGVRLSSGMITNPIGYDDYGAKSRTRSPVDRDGNLEDFRSNPQSYFEMAEARHKNFAYCEVGQVERGGIGTRSTESYGKVEGVGEDYGHQDVSRLRMLDPTMDKVDGSSHHGYLKGNRLWNPPLSSPGQLTTDFHGGYESLHARRKEVDDHHYGSPRSIYEKEFYHSNGSLRLGERHHDYAISGSPWSPHKQSDRLPIREYDRHLDNFDGRPQERLMLDNMRLPRPSKETLKRSHGMEKQSKHGSTIYDLGDAGEPRRDDIDSNFLSKKLKVSESKYGKTRKASDVVGYHQLSSGTSSLSVPSNLGKPHKLGTSDIKRRLGPGPPKVHVSQRLVRKYKPSLSKRLGPGPQKNHATLPWLKNLKTSPKFPRIQDVSDGSHLDQGEEPQEDNLTPTKPEPPESSEEFRQMVFSSFFKFVKQLNETPAKRRKYNKQGKAGSLKCIVCGSGSEEFGDTESLAIHAFTSEKVGLRAQHLGFHKALCALKGWKSAETFSNTWICETLSHADNLSQKEDLILWPPVVIIHNSSIGSQSPDQWVIVSVGELDAKLRDMGFGNKMKVYRGKPANESVMVVQFGGTLSGLQEAERLHKIYVESKHGRAEFLKAKPCNHGSHSGEAKVLVVQNILYGYLGIAEDLDKLDFDIKRRCVVKSKKDIQDIAEAPLNTE